MSSSCSLSHGLGRFAYKCGEAEPTCYLQVIYILFIGDAVVWAESDGEVYELLNAEALTQYTADTSEARFIAKIPSVFHDSSHFLLKSRPIWANSVSQRIDTV